MNRVPIVMTGSKTITSNLAVEQFLYRNILISDFVTPKWGALLPLFSYIKIKYFKLTFSEPRIFLATNISQPTQLVGGSADSIYVVLDRDHEFKGFPTDLDGADRILRSSPQARKLRTDRPKPICYTISLPKVANQCMEMNNFVKQVGSNVGLDSFIAEYTSMNTIRLPSHFFASLGDYGDNKSVFFKFNVKYSVGATLHGFKDVNYSSSNISNLPNMPPAQLDLNSNISRTQTIKYNFE